MKNNYQRFIKYLKQHVKLATFIFTMTLMIFDVLLMLFGGFRNHLAFSHMMYIPIILMGSFHGPIVGLLTGLIGGLLVGPLMPYNITDNIPQYWADWLFRMLIMTLAGLMSGLFGEAYQQLKTKVNIMELKNPDSGLANINALRKLDLVERSNYTLATLIIANQSAICDVMGFQAYYDFLKMIETMITKKYPDINVFQPSINQLWLIKPSLDFTSEMESYLQTITEAAHSKPEHLFVDFSLGFFQKRHHKDRNILTYFIESDLAAKEAKTKNLTYLTYSDLLTTRQFEYELLADFSKALYDGSIYLVYQPKIDLKTKKPTGLEALIRWQHKTKKLITPDQFIRAVETTNMIHDMTQQVFRWSLMYQQKLQELGITLPISINISTRNLYDENFFKKMIHILNEYNIKPSLVELEITETVLMENPDLSRKTLENFSSEGFKIAIDDFGKGYSSLAYLAQFPINTIKIDRIFTRQILVNPTTQHIVKATIDLAKQLGYEVLIEGIEDKETADLLERLGCHSAQGYYYLKPKKDSEIITYLKQFNNKAS